MKISTPPAVPRPLATDPLVRKLTSNDVEAHVAEYLRLLDTKARESKLQEFLSAHSYFFRGMLDPFRPLPLYSKVRLGHDYEVDFAWLYHDSFGPEWRLIEIESPSGTLFTKSGNASAKLTHAIQQARDWAAWVHDHQEYARRLMPSISYPFCYIFLGRRNEITPANRAKLKRFRYDYRRELEIHTLDWFASSARTFGFRIGTDGPRWQIPMQALTHRDLKNGLPEEVKFLVENDQQSMTKHRIDQRDMRYHRGDELGGDDQED